jgi:hypothetical protein
MRCRIRARSFLERALRCVQSQWDKQKQKQPWQK